MNPLKRIVIILVFIVLLPALFFSVYEINQLSENERLIQGIYSNQLDAILTSINQYSEDVVFSWTKKINFYITESQDSEIKEDFLKDLFDTNSSLDQIIIADSARKKISFNYIRKQANQLSAADIKSIINKNKNKIEKLYGYKKAGYHKIWNIEVNKSGNSGFLFIVEGIKKQSFICIISFNTLFFINDVLALKAKDVAKDEFIISIINSKNNRIMSSTEGIRAAQIEQRKSLWLLPDFDLGITLKGRTIEALVKQSKERANFSFILIVALNIFVLIGFWLVFRNIKKEIELARIKSDFVSNVSHELRTPLALISMFAETLELNRVRSEEKKQEYYTIISQETNRLGIIVNKILNFSKVEAGKIKYHLQEINFNSIVDDIYKTYRFHLQNNGFEFKLNKFPDLQDVCADPEAMKEAVINLIDNSVKYSSDKKIVELSTGVARDGIFIEVKDQGIGIAEADKKRIFEKFYRVHTGLVHNVKGTGLGLSLVQHIIKAHNGKIIVESSPGKGSTFRLLIPLNNKKSRGK